MARRKKPIEGELTLKELRSVVGGSAVILLINGSAHDRHNALHHGHGHSTSGPA